MQFLFSQFTSVSGYGGRIALYFAIFDVIVIPRAMSALKLKKWSNNSADYYTILYVYWWFICIFRNTSNSAVYVYEIEEKLNRWIRKLVLCQCKGLLIMGPFAAYGLKKMIESISKSEVEFVDYRFWY